MGDWFWIDDRETYRGFTNTGQSSRAFRQYVGVSPSEWKRQTWTEAAQSRIEFVDLRVSAELRSNF